MKATTKVASRIYGTIAIVLIACVAAALWPVLQKQKPHDGGPTTICHNNLLVLGLAMQQYVQDYDGQFPPGEATGLGDGWAGAIFPYVKSAKAFYCPEERDGMLSDDEPNSSRVSYSINETLTADRQVPNCSTKVSRLKNPADTVELFETTGVLVRVTKPDEGRGDGEHTGWYSGAGNGMTNSPYGPHVNLYAWGDIDYATGDIGTRHGAPSLARHPRGKAWYLAADGHVALLAPWKVSSGNTPKLSGPQAGGPYDGTAASTDHLDSDSMTFSAR